MHSVNIHSVRSITWVAIKEIYKTKRPIKWYSECAWSACHSNVKDIAERKFKVIASVSTVLCFIFLECHAESWLLSQDLETFPLHFNQFRTIEQHWKWRVYCTKSTSWFFFFMFRLPKYNFRAINQILLFADVITLVNLIWCKHQNQFEYCNLFKCIIIVDWWNEVVLNPIEIDWIMGKSIFDSEISPSSEEMYTFKLIRWNERTQNIRVFRMFNNFRRIFLALKRKAFR